MDPLLLAQAAALAGHVQLDVAKLLLGLIATVLSMLVAVVGFFLRRLLTGLDAHRTHVDEQFDGVHKELQRQTQELFGPTGTNGMRGDLRQTKRLVIKHDRVIIRLAERAGVPVPEDEDE